VLYDQALVAFQRIAEQHFLDERTVRRWWAQFKERGQYRHKRLLRNRRIDSRLTMLEVEWLVERISDTPDLYISELRRLFVHFYPRKAYVSGYVIEQALIVRSLTRLHDVVNSCVRLLSLGR